ncbi:MAG TPA: DUF4465 domain-containing protein [Pirellulales bacterium]|jgi:hypothetical protein
MRDRNALHLGLMVLAFYAGTARAQIVNFDDLPLAPNTFYEGADNAGQFVSDGATFNNSFTDYGGGVTSWEGWAYSDQTTTLATADLSVPDYQYQFSAAAGAGSGGSANYGIGFTNTFVLPAPIVQLPADSHPLSLQVTNTTYDVLSMFYGDDFSKKFSGPVGSTPGDWFKLTITGLNAGSQPIGSVDFYLADFRSADPAKDYIVNSWQNVNLTSLYNATALSFSLSSSDNGDFGMNTPAYFAADDLSLTKVRGDTNNDGVVNGLDLNAIAQNWLKFSPAGDTNGDGIVNGLDVNQIASHWLDKASGTPVATPEPAALSLAVLGLVSLAMATKLRPWTANRPTP